MLRANRRMPLDRSEETYHEITPSPRTCVANSSLLRSTLYCALSALLGVLLAACSNEPTPTPLHVVAWDGDLAELQALLGAGTDPKAKAAYGETPLDIAEEEGNPCRHRVASVRTNGDAGGIHPDSSVSYIRVE